MTQKKEKRGAYSQGYGEVLPGASGAGCAAGSRSFGESGA